VVWLLGDESTHDETFSAAEQALVKSYLEAGGRLFVSGSEIAWDLDQDNSSSGSTPEDEAFLHSYLKADYVADDAGVYSVAGAAGGIFSGMSFQYGTSTSPYPEDYPDAIRPVGGGRAALLYANSGRIAAVQYEGIFGRGTRAGKLVYLAFPFETISGADTRAQVMGRVLAFFFGPTYVRGGPGGGPTRFALFQNYPNPFNPETTIQYALPVQADVRLEILDALGRRVEERKFPSQPPGVHRFRWLAEKQPDLASGVFFVRLTVSPLEDSHAAVRRFVRKMILVK